MTAVPYSIDWWQIFLGGVSTLAIFSFVYRENPVYRLFEHFYIGIATAYGIMATVRDFLWPRVLQPMLGMDRPLFPDGTYPEPYEKLQLLYVIPMIFGMLYYTILSRRWNWIAQLVIGFSFGVSAGLSLKGIFVELTPQLTKSFRPLYIPNTTDTSFSLWPLVLPDPWKQTLSNWVFLFTLVTAMSYFFFTFRRRTGGVVERASVAGRWMLMGCFGAFFGSTITARMALLVERLEFLIHDWLPLLKTWIGGT